MTAPTSAPRARLIDVLIGVSLAADVGTGHALESGLQVCLLATALGRQAEMVGEQLQAVFQAAVLHGLGCTSHASENAAMFEDDLAFQRAYRVFDAGDPAVAAAQLDSFGHWAGPRQALLRQRFVEAAPTVGPYAGAACAEVSAELGQQLGLVPLALTALAEVYERFDGLGIPDGRAGEAISLPGRVVAVAEQAVAALTSGGVDEAAQEVARRAGGHLDPDLCAIFLGSAEVLLDAAAPPDIVAAVRAVEPLPAVTYAAHDLPRLCEALAAFTDLKGTHLLGHSSSVADLVGRAVVLSGWDTEAQRRLCCAALLHDVGRLAVPSSVWDRPGPLRPAERERVDLHPHWTLRILRRCPLTADLASLAAAHHERLDGTGYHRGLAAPHLDADARLLAAADTFSALVEPRPHRPAHSRAQAAAHCARLVRDGLLDANAVGAVTEAAGVPLPPRETPSGLTAREVEVLGLVARGLTNAQVADLLHLSAKTIQHHLAHIYDKTGRRTRAGAAVLAMRHGLLPPSPPAE